MLVFGQRVTISSLLSDAQVTCVVTSRNKHFFNPILNVPLDAPVKLRQEYRNPYTSMLDYHGF